jgi:Family of unknown function (DUF6328)
MSKKLDSKLKTALDEARLLFLGGQVLLGFQFQAFFQDGFSTLSFSAKYLSLGGLALMVVSMALLVAPVMQHRLVERGDASPRLLRTTTRFAAASLAPLAVSLAVATYVVIGRHYGMVAGVLSGLCMGMACGLFWFGIEAYIGISEGAGEMKETSTPLKTKVEQLLTEARVIIPGGQALFGFQFIAMLTTGFDKLPSSSQLVHTAALCFTALNVIVLMAPAALHRLSFAGEDSEAFLQLGSALLIAAPMLLALAVAAELYVVFDKVLADSVSASIASLGGWLVMTAFWYVIPLGLKSSRTPVSVRDERPEQLSGKPSLVK